MTFKALIPFLPANTFPYIESILSKTPLLIKITAPRKTRYGSFSAKKKTGRYTINISGDLNAYAFLITLVHEIAHIKCWEIYGNKVPPHGKEWKNFYINLMSPLLTKDIFPEDLLTALSHHLSNPKSSGSYDSRLVKILHIYDKNNGFVYVEDISPGGKFLYSGNRMFIRGEKLRRRYRCEEVATKRIYLFNPVAEVVQVESMSSENNPV